MLAPSDSPAKLMKLGQPKAFHIFNQHNRGVWNIDSHFNHCRANQGIGFASPKPFHDVLFFLRGNAAVQQLTTKRLQTFPP